MLSRIALSLVSLFLIVGPEVRAEIPESSFIFNKRCALCHNVAALTPRIRSIPEDKRRTFLENFLVRHHTRDAEERASIIEFILHQPN